MATTSFLDEHFSGSCVEHSNFQGIMCMFFALTKDIFADKSCYSRCTKGKCQETSGAFIHSDLRFEDSTENGGTLMNAFFF